MVTFDRAGHTMLGATDELRQLLVVVERSLDQRALGVRRRSNDANEQHAAAPRARGVATPMRLFDARRAHLGSAADELRASAEALGRQTAARRRYCRELAAARSHWRCALHLARFFVHGAPRSLSLPRVCARNPTHPHAQGRHREEPRRFGAEAAAF